MQRISRWGNSLALRLPSAVLEAAGLQEGSMVSVRLLDSGDLRLRPHRGRKPAGDYAAPVQRPPTIPQEW
ncbi:AbrB/MazE/SpoVT family DNA-binding domain-containing protein [Caenimonas sedimenti]|uniref:AbrB/MazE/SpoVT family DNA-binding domain-containing protein n=2 Tax=Caenimonas sedimenti TaxID=2596921 RepID=A0A562ZXB2_9BURK|nr:AbrB/MazE/SpoVT family DNA-binding domain-containing protein [Caenimonas sedimenti]TWO73260.1 AbrB/MazE/SpoVT family DNA-binding domain-containing protein [Caenimonas sedimenti]